MKKLKVAFDGQLFLKGNKTGIAWCTEYLILELSKFHNIECIINVFTKNYSKEELEQLNKYREHGCKIQSCNWFHDTWYKYLWQLLPIPYSLFFNKKVDVTIFPNFIVPPGVKGKSIAIVHDMAYKACPETVREKTKWWLRKTMKGSCRRANHIVTVSHFSKEELMKYLKIKSNKITVIQNGVEQGLYHPNYDKKQIEEVKKKYHINEKYFLYLGTLEPRKNIVRIIRAYEKLQKKQENIPKLVLAGGKGWLYEEIFELVKTLCLEDKIIFTGYVGTEEAPKLMCGAEGFLFPSLYEGFGMPVIEAMACGVPVITSNTTSLKEIAEGAAILVNPESEKDIYHALKILIQDDNQKWREKAMERIKNYTWSVSGIKMKKIIERVCQK